MFIVDTIPIPPPFALALVKGRGWGGCDRHSLAVRLRRGDNFPSRRLVLFKTFSSCPPALADEHL